MKRSEIMRAQLAQRKSLEQITTQIKATLFPITVASVGEPVAMRMPAGVYFVIPSDMLSRLLELAFKAGQVEGVTA